MPSFEQYPLMAYLKRNGEGYFWKVQEVRKVIPGWLGYVKETFPHYTDHTERHSEEIVRQISKLLFTNEDVSRPVIKLSAVEAYILIAAAFFHDAGMVASNAEKEQILKSDAWKDWTTGNGDGAERRQKIENFRGGQEPPEEGLRDFLADIQVRHLIAEFIRRQHHARAAIVIEQYQNQLGRFAFDDRQLQETISKVCVAHGLKHRDLEDSDQYPYEQDIIGETVNVRLMAILLRLGDLLDMSSNRACPLLLNAASPLPADSLPHWTQYHRIDRQTRPGLIEIRAKCMTQDEHRVLQDWCQWLVDETQHAYTLMARSTHHANWRPPFAKFEKGSIIIEAAEGANYIPSTWKLQLDQDVIFKTLIEDRYDDRSFILELITNALDATRCQMYADLGVPVRDQPEYPTQVEEARRNEYTIHIGLRMEKLPNRLPGEPDERQIFSIEDRGIGMDGDIIQRYLLQIGRSFYTTDEFTKSFRFFPTSRSGMEFLSIFKVSDKVIVETYKTSSLRLTLTGTRNYPLTERGNRDKNGTKIEVHLRGEKKMKQGDLTELITDWCKRVEFPIEVDDLGGKNVIQAEQMKGFVREMPDPNEDGAKFVIKAFPINRPGLEGELYVLARVSAIGESWALSSRHGDGDREREVWQAERPRCPGNLVCLHGLGQDQETRSQAGKDFTQCVSITEARSSD